MTGGAFDKEYDEIHGTLDFRETHLPQMLEMARSRLDVRVETLMLVDSSQMSEADRTLVAERCRAAPEQRIVITHGTDTMVETSAALEGLGGKTIVLTGSLNPARFESSDAVFNIGLAVAAAQTSPPGVYIAMNGRVFDAGAVRKNRARNRFEPVDP